MGEWENGWASAAPQCAMLPLDGNKVVSCNYRLPVEVYFQRMSKKKNLKKFLLNCLIIDIIFKLLFLFGN